MPSETPAEKLAAFHAAHGRPHGLWQRFRWWLADGNNATMFFVYAMFPVAAAVILIVATVNDWIAGPHYRGEVDGIRGLRGGVVIDLDGRFPNQKMTVWVPRADLPQVEQGLGVLWPPHEGDTVRVFGATSEYRGRPEIVVTSARQLQYHHAPDPDSDAPEDRSP